jgi:hypothetical protein
MYRGKESCEEHMVLDEIRRPDHPAFKTKANFEICFRYLKQNM